MAEAAKHVPVEFKESRREQIAVDHEHFETVELPEQSDVEKAEGRRELAELKLRFGGSVLDQVGNQLLVGNEDYDEFNPHEAA
ncbi:MAG TPA: hypothetical protein VFG56_00220 [Candidatus Saccharimonadales bacterium]|nr:hypothetical protein [Candidatus Saccharimonadales bacterium]